MAVSEPVSPAHPPPVVVTLPAEIDMANADRVYRQIAAEFARGAQVVIADMTGTTFCDTLGTRALVQAYHLAAPDGADLRLLPSPQVMQMRLNGGGLRQQLSMCGRSTGSSVQVRPGRSA